MLARLIAAMVASISSRSSDLVLSFDWLFWEAATDAFGDLPRGEAVPLNPNCVNHCETCRTNKHSVNLQAPARTVSTESADANRAALWMELLVHAHGQRNMW